MTHIYFDDSHHDRGAFSVGAFAVYDEEPTERIERAIAECGFRPGEDEYKSRHVHGTDSRWAELRRLLFRVASAAHIGLVIAPRDDRKRFGLHALMGLSHILAENAVQPPVNAFFDQGLFRSPVQFEEWHRQSGVAPEVRITTECDSRLVLGIQTADLVAHSCAVVLLGWLGIAEKTLHNDREGEYQLSFEMWARLSGTCQRV